MLEREVAIKALRPELASQPQVVERFRSEAVTLAKLNHQNIAALYSFFRQGDEFFMVMEFMRGRTLDEIITKDGAMPCEEAISLFCHALEGIGYAHRMGIVHRDIKPANMMLTEDGTLKVMDFGIARVLGTARMTRAGNVIGTIEYMSPEQVRGKETDERSDIYSLGILLFELLTGRLPFVSENEFELMKLQTEGEPPAPRSLNPNIPEAVEAAILRAMAKNPDDRFQSVQEFRDELFRAELPETVNDALAAVRKGKTGNRASKPPISRSTTKNTNGAKATRLATSSTQAGVGPKETRLGDAAVVAAAKAQVKGTRLATAPAPAAPPAKAGMNPKVLYFGGAGAAIVLMAIVAVVIVVMDRKPQAKPAVVALEQPSPTPAQNAAVSAPQAPAEAAPSTPAATPAPTAQPLAIAPPSADGVPTLVVNDPPKPKQDADDSAARREKERRRAAEAERQRKIKEGLKLLEQ